MEAGLVTKFSREVYNIQLVMLIDSEDKYQNAMNVLERVVGIIEKEGKIKVSRYRVENITEISFAEVKHELKELDFDYLSY